MGLLALTPSLLHSVLVHETMAKVIRSVCFSPNGRLLATGAEDGVVRVSSRIIMLEIVVVVIIFFEANAQHRMMFGALGLGHRQGVDPQQIPGSHQVDLLARFLVGREIARLWVCRLYGKDLGLGCDWLVVEDPCNHRQC